MFGAVFDGSGATGEGVTSGRISLTLWNKLHFHCPSDSVVVAVRKRKWFKRHVTNTTESRGGIELLF